MLMLKKGKYVIIRIILNIFFEASRTSCGEMELHFPMFDVHDSITSLNWLSFDEKYPVKNPK